VNCLLCSHAAEDFLGVAFKCTHCSLVFKNPTLYLSTEEDLRRYSLHQNNAEDEGYVKFLGKLLNPLEKFLPSEFTSLDFGCGPGPVLSQLLKEKGGVVSNFDPIFHKNISLLERQFDVVTATEVVEHFKKPEHDWTLLISLVASRGILGIMTEFLEQNIDYHKWWYKNDPTHVAFYNSKTFEFLEDAYGLERLYEDKKSVIIFRKK
jgi:2-polyprenyl-3-methyl-5-hydroxy-6-metoxy-1,4-benzoquinol methylase